MNQKYDIDVPEAGTLEEILDVDFDKIDKIQIEVLFPIRSVEITDSSTIQTYLNRFQSSNFSRDSDNLDRSSFGGGGGIYTTLYQKGQKVASFNFGSKSFSFSRADFCGSIFYHTEERLWQDDLLEGIEGWVYQHAD